MFKLRILIFLVLPSFFFDFFTQVGAFLNFVLVLKDTIIIISRYCYKVSLMVKMSIGYSASVACNLPRFWYHTLGVKWATLNWLAFDIRDWRRMLLSFVAVTLPGPTLTGHRSNCCQHTVKWYHLDYTLKKDAKWTDIVGRSTHKACLLLSFLNFIENLYILHNYANAWLLVLLDGFVTWQTLHTFHWTSFPWMIYISDNRIILKYQVHD